MAKFQGKVALIAVAVVFLTSSLQAGETSSFKQLNIMPKIKVGMTENAVKKLIGEPIFLPGEMRSYYPSDKICYVSKYGEANCGIIVNYSFKDMKKVVDAVSFEAIKE